MVYLRWYEGNSCNLLSVIWHRNDMSVLPRGCLFLFFDRNILCIFKQILGIPMGGNASPFIANLYLSWCKYCYMTKIVKTDYAMAKLLSYNCRYLDDICTVNFKYFGDIAIYIYIYMTAHCWSKVVHAVTNRTPSWIFISVLLTANLWLASIIKWMISTFK